MVLRLGRADVEAVEVERPRDLVGEKGRKVSTVDAPDELTHHPAEVQRVVPVRSPRLPQGLQPLHHRHHRVPVGHRGHIGHLAADLRQPRLVAEHVADGHRALAELGPHRRDGCVVVDAGGG